MGSGLVLPNGQMFTRKKSTCDSIRDCSSSSEEATQPSVLIVKEQERLYPAHISSPVSSVHQESHVLSILSSFINKVLIRILIEIVESL